MEIVGTWGRLTVTDDVLEALAAAAVPDAEGMVWLRRPKRVTGRLRRPTEPDSTGAVAVRPSDQDGVTVDVHVAVAWGAPIDRVARGIRNRVEQALQEALGIRLERLTVHVDAVRPPDALSRHAG